MEEHNKTANTIKAYGSGAGLVGKYDLRLGSFTDSQSSTSAVWSPNENGVPAYPLAAPQRIKSGAPIQPSGLNPQVQNACARGVRSCESNVKQNEGH